MVMSRMPIVLAALFVLFLGSGSPRVPSPSSMEPNRKMARELSGRLLDPVVVYETDWFRIIASESYDKKVREQVGPAVVEAVAEFCDLVGFEEEGFLWEGEEKGRLVLIKSRKTFQRYVTLFDNEASPDRLSPGFADTVDQSQSFYWIEPTPYAVCCGEGANFEDINRHLFHLLGHILLTQFEYNYRFAPAWFHEGFGAYIAVRYAGGNILYCTKGLNNALFGTGIYKGLTAWARSANWPDFLRQEHTLKEILSLEELSHLPLSEFSHPDAALSWSFVSFLIDRYPERLRAYVQALKKDASKKLDYNDWTPLDLGLRAFREAFGRGFGEMEPEWKAWAAEWEPGPDWRSGKKTARRELGTVRFDPAEHLPEFSRFEGIEEAMDDLEPFTRRTGEWVPPEELEALLAEWELVRLKITAAMKRKKEEALGGKLSGSQKALSLSELVSLPEARFMTFEELAALIDPGKEPEFIRSVVGAIVERFGCAGAAARLEGRLEALDCDLEEEVALLIEASRMEAASFEGLSSAGVSLQTKFWPDRLQLEGWNEGELFLAAKKPRGTEPNLPPGCRMEDKGDTLEIRCPLSVLDLKTYIGLCKTRLKKKSDEDRAGYALQYLFRGDVSGCRKELKGVKKLADRKERIEKLMPKYRTVAEGAAFLSLVTGVEAGDSMEDLTRFKERIQGVKDSPLFNVLKPRCAAILRRLLFENYIGANRFVRTFKGFQGTEGASGAARFLYGFDDPLELEEFDFVPPLLEGHLRTRYRLESFPGKEPLSLDQGILNCYGQEFITFKPVFNGEVEIRLRMRIEAREGENSEKYYVLFGYGLTPTGGFVASSCLSFVETQPSVGGGNRLHKAYESLAMPPSHQWFDLVLKGTADRILYTFHDGEEKAIPEKGLRQGQVFLWLYGPREFKIDQMEVKGEIDPAWLRDTAEKAVEEELKIVM